MSHVEHLTDDYLHDLLDVAETRRVAEHCAECAQCKAALDAARKRLAGLRDVPPTEATPELVTATLEQIEPKPIDRRWVRRVWYALTSLAACALVLFGVHWHYSSLRANPIDLTVLGQRDLLAEANASVRVRLYDRAAGQALAEIPAKVELVADDGTVKASADFQTDARGIGQPVFAVPDLPDGDYRIRVTAATPTKPESVEQRVRVRRSWQVMLSTDKPLYQPGQTIHLRSLALRKPALLPVAKADAVFTLTDPRGNILFKETIPTSAYGIAAVDCPLASELAEGTYSLACKVGDSESRQPVSILKYVLPKFAVDLAFDKKFYQPGDEVVCVTRVTYNTGKPVVGGRVLLKDEQGIFGQLRGETDAEGKVTLRGRIRADVNVVDLRLNVVCEATDRAEQKNVRNSSILVTTKPLRIDLIPENGNLVAGVSNTIHVLAHYADGTPAQVHVSVDGQLEEIKTDALGSASFRVTPTAGLSLRYRVANENGRVLESATRNFDCGPSGSDFLIRTDRAVYRGGQTMKIRVQGSGTDPIMVDLIREGNERYTLRSELIEMNGEKEIDLNPDLVGTLSLLAYRFVGDAVAVQKSRIVQVLPAGELQIRATLDREEYRPGGEAKLTFQLTDAEGKPRVGAISLAGVDRAVFAMLPIKPGSEATFFTLDAKALEAVTSRYQWSPVSTRNEGLDSAVFSSTARTFTPPRQTPQEMPARGLDMDEAMPMRVIKPTASTGGDGLSLSAQSYREKLLTLSELKAAAHTWLVRGWVVLGCVLLGIGYSSLWVLLERREVLALHGGIALIGIPAVVMVMFVSMGSLNRSTFSMVAGNVAMSPRMAREADDRFFRFDEPVGGVGGDKPRLREYFPETLVWKPELVTDEHGSATLTLPLADSITTWKLSASAVDAGGRLGARELDLKVFQPFFVDFNLPVALTRNDQVRVPVVVSSYLDKPQTVKLTLKAADWYELIDGKAEQEVEIGPGEVKAVYYRVAVRKVGERHLEVTAVAANVSDAVKRPIEVLADGRPIDLTASGSLETPFTRDLTLPDDAIEGSGRLLLKVYPSRFSQVVEGLDNIFRMPYGCFEQTSSTTYPNVLALDYLQRTRQSKPEVEAKARHYIRLGYQRLLGFEVTGGGFDWFGRGPANVTLTAYGLMEFEDMAKVHSVDPALIERTRRWLLNQRNDGQWRNDGRLAHIDPTGENAHLATTAYVARAVFAEGRGASGAGPTRDYLLQHKPDTIANPYTLALVASALLGIDTTGSIALPYLERLDRMVTAGNEGQAFWAMPQDSRTAFYGAGDAGNIEATALATLALLQAKKSPETVRRALAWIVSRKDRQGTWHSTQATVLSLQALLAAAAREAEEPKDREIVVQFGDHRETIRVPKEKAEVMQFVDLSKHLTPGKKTLEVSEPTKTGTGFQVTYRYHRPGGMLIEENAPLAVSMHYDRTEVARGGSISAAVRIRNGARQAAAMLLVEVPVPAGFATRPEEFAKLAADGTIARFQTEPGRVLVYLREMPKNGRLELPFTLDATQVVDTAVAGGRVYEYYDPAREAFGAPARLRVTE